MSEWGLWLSQHRYFPAFWHLHCCLKRHEERYKYTEKKLLADFAVFPCHIFVQSSFFLLLCRLRKNN